MQWTRHSSGVHATASSTMPVSRRDVTCRPWCVCLPVGQQRERGYLLMTDCRPVGRRQEGGCGHSDGPLSSGLISSRCSRHLAAVSTAGRGVGRTATWAGVANTDRRPSWIKKEKFAGCGGRQADRQVRGCLPGRRLPSTCRYIQRLCTATVCCWTGWAVH